MALAVLTASAEQRQKVVLMLDWFPNPNHVPLYVTQRKGFFEAAGLDVAIQVPADPNDPVKLAAVGKVDFAISYEPSVIIARDQELPITSIGVLVEHPLNTVMFLQQTGITKPRDFKGKTIGIAVSPLDEVLFDAIAKKAGLRRGDYEYVNVGFNLSPALLSGRVDAVVGAYKNYEKIQLELEGKEVGILPLEENGVPDYYELVFIANETILDKRPEVARRFLHAIQRGIQLTLSDTRAALEVFFAAHPDLRDELNRRAFAATLPYYARTQTQDSEKWAAFQDFMLKGGLIKTKTDLSKLYTNRFAPGEKGR
jgi:putative hydroxymethylpyrimidine transport system substrate-binding protein